jgi:hypothetical protein
LTTLNLSLISFFATHHSPPLTTQTPLHQAYASSITDDLDEYTSTLLCSKQSTSYTSENKHLKMGQASIIATTLAPLVKIILVNAFADPYWIRGQTKESLTYRNSVCRLFSAFIKVALAAPYNTDEVTSLFIPADDPSNRNANAAFAVTGRQTL